MRANAGIFILICLLFLVGTVGAVIPDSVTITSDKPAWIIANNVDQSTFTIFAVNSSTGVVENANVDFAINNTLGTLSSTSGITVSGKTSTTFKVKTTSGSTKITAIVHGTGVDASYTNTVTLTQNIDHDILIPEFTPTTGNVTEVITFNVSITDQWGNPIDNRRGDNTVSLSVTCPLPNDCNFVGYGHSFSSQPDSNGNLEIPLQLGTKTGVTTIVMSPVQDLKEQVFMIDTKPGDLTLTAEVSPTSLSVPAGTGVFKFYYTLTDQFGNPGANQPIQIQTSLGETQLTYTDFFGRTPIQTYGPKAVISTVIITAIAVNPPAITNPYEFTVNFAAPMSQDMTISEAPHILESYDEDPTSYSDVFVRVHDEYGKPLGGQQITFTLSYPVSPLPLDWDPNHIPYLHSPSEQSYTTTTDPITGKATVRFVPGGFTRPGPLEGSCLVTATWNKNPVPISKTTTLTWSNRPYLDINAGVNPEIINLGDEIDVTITVSVNGNPHFRPVSMVLDHDVSGAMSSVENHTTRLEKATAAATVFLNSLIADEVDINHGHIAPT